MSNPVPFRYLRGDRIELLVVDDDPIQREFSMVYLSSPDVEVTTAESAEDGLAMLALVDFDMLLVDVDMPGMSGIEMVRRLRTDPRYNSVPIMVITGREDMISIDQAYEAGATSFMCKPVNWRLLSHQVRFLLRAHLAMTKAA